MISVEGEVEGGVESGYWLGWFSYSTTFITWASKFRQESTEVKLPQLFKLTIPPLCVPINTFYIHIFICPYYEVAPVLVHTIQLTLQLVVIVMLAF